MVLTNQNVLRTDVHVVHKRWVRVCVWSQLHRPLLCLQGMTHISMMHTDETEATAK